MSNPNADIHASQPNPQVKAEIYFGLSIAGKQAVDADTFAAFLGRAVTPHFPGFAVQNVLGYWKGEPEAAAVLIILGDDVGQFRQQIRSIAEMYKSDFLQEAVAYSFTPCSFALNCWPFGPVASYHKPGLGY